MVVGIDVTTRAKALWGGVGSTRGALMRARRIDSLNVNVMVSPRHIKRAASFDLSRFAGGPADVATTSL
jgi:hypothetical protein